MPKNLLSPSHYRWELLFWLWLAFFLNQADRAIFGVVLTEIKSELALSDAQVGLIGSVLFWTLAILVPFAGYAGDIFRRSRIITFCLAFWSVATTITGLSQGVVSLVLFRSIATGSGEAFYAPAANAMISQFHQKNRSLALSIHQTALYLGLVLIGFLGGWVAELWGWRAAFYVFGSTGIFLAMVFMFRLKDFPVPQQVSPVVSNKKKRSLSPPFTQSLLILLKTPTAMLFTIAFTAIVFVNNGYVTWAPTFLQERFGMPLATAGGFSMLYHHVFALVGILIGGPVTDIVVKRYRGIRLCLQCACLLLGAPFIVLMGMGESPLAIYIGMGGFGFFRGIFEANTYATLYDVIEPRLRSSASGVMICFAYLVGAFSPWIIGEIKPHLGLSVALASLSIAYVIGAIAVLIALLWFFKHDYLDESQFF